MPRFKRRIGLLSYVRGRPSRPNRLKGGFPLFAKPMNKKMKIVVIGGSGLIGTKVVNNLRQRGHEVVAGSPSTGVNTITGEGLADALTGAQVVVDVANAPVWEDKAVLEFFETSGRNLLAAEATAGVRHHVALSVVGTERLLASGYFRAKLAQEALIKASPIPYTIVRATQFFEFVGGIAKEATEGQTVRVPAAMMQPIVSDDVGAVVANVALAEPLNGMVETAGPDPIRQDELVRQFLKATGDPRTVVTDASALYYGIALNDQSLTPGDNPILGPTHFRDWLANLAKGSKAKAVYPPANRLVVTAGKLKPKTPSKVISRQSATTIRMKTLLARWIAGRLENPCRRAASLPPGLSSARIRPDSRARTALALPAPLRGLGPKRESYQHSRSAGTLAIASSYCRSLSREREGCRITHAGDHQAKPHVPHANLVLLNVD